MEERKPEIERVFGARRTKTVVELLTLLEFAWHDCYGEVSPPEDVIADVLALSQGDIDALVHATHLAVIDRRDLHVAVHGM